ncbi:hypothetical protein MsAg5_08340 [Methanosarcinaceae archaeon Ag5]|uniref:Uncharacterized protein n=1 Tax=Methanolapillus africanus TaxID=3028297 RepID=A0AAE4SCY6_9EURY|nr:hypothetical protein [Methanosarcinaceae archaeon Ag5]
MKRKTIAVLIILVLLISIFSAGYLLVGRYLLYYSGAPIAVDYTGIPTKAFVSNPENIPRDSTIRAYSKSTGLYTLDYVAYTPRSATSYSDVVVYGTAKEVRSFWTTPDGSAPELGDVQTREWVDHNTNVTHIEQYVESEKYEIHTYVYFTVDRKMKGNCSDEIALFLSDGQVDNVIMYNIDPPHCWDFKPGDRCLLYLYDSPKGYQLIAPYGVRTVFP